MSSKLVLLGVGHAALAVRRVAGTYSEIVGTTRSAERLPILEEAGISPILIETDNFQLSDAGLKEALSGADVLVSYPPDNMADRRFSQLASGARAIVYISSTGVYGKLSGKIDEASPVDGSSETAAARLAAEAIWQAHGAVVLRAAGLYDESSGLIRRLQAGTYRIPGDGSNYISRIHINDLARIILAAFRYAKPGAIYLAADSYPATHMAVVKWLCDHWQIPIPVTVPLSEVHESLRGNRQICSARVLQDLKVTLEYPSFKEGYAVLVADQKPRLLKT